MKIAIMTVPFLPQLGGVETVVALLSRELVKLGCEVKVATMTPSSQKDSFSYEVIRQPGWKKTWQTWWWADAVLLQGLTLRMGWPALFCSKPCLITHHMMLDQPQHIGVVRRILLARSHSVSVSHAVARSLPVPSTVIQNPYNAEIFHNHDNENPDRDLVFVGRLCADKGADLLLSALQLLAGKNIKPTLTIVGDGKERPALEAQVRKLGLEKQVQFTGAVAKMPLARILQNHRIMVIPSRCEEGFGIVALEGIACGCAVIGSSGGGLPEAIGLCGVVFPKGDAVALAEKIEMYLKQPELSEECQRNGANHLAIHEPATIAQKYLKRLTSG